MKIVLFYHSLISDWNHGNAHFLRGIATEFFKQGHTVDVYEPEKGWSFQQLTKHYGDEPVADFYKIFPHLNSTFYDIHTINLDTVLNDADLVIVHEWNNPLLISKIGRHRVKNRNYLLYFHDTHHRSVSKKKEMEAYDLSHYDGVLAFGNIIRDIYLRNGWIKTAWTWHEAADNNLFHPMIADQREGDLVWIGNWGDDERTAELKEFIIDPVKEMNLKARFYGVRYPKEAIQMLADAGIEYGEWLPNHKVPEMFARYKVTVHVPRRPYVKQLPGIPTIRPFEAMACKIPLICSPWQDSEKLFSPGKDYLPASSGREMKNRLESILGDKDKTDLLTGHALSTIQNRHSCGHRVDQLMDICEQTRFLLQPKKIISHQL